jgi:hypothetical protein
MAGGAGAASSETEAMNARSHRGLNRCRQPRLATLAGITSLAAAISYSGEGDPAGP